MAITELIKKMGTVVSNLVEFADFFADILSIRRSGDVSDKLIKIGMTKEDADKTTERIERIKVHLGGIGAGDELIMTEMLLKIEFERRQAFSGFMSWAKENHYIEHNFIYRHLVLNAEYSMDKKIVIIEDVINVLQENSNSKKDVLNYCQDIYLADDSTYQLYLRIKTRLTGLLKDSYGFVVNKCQDGGAFDVQLQTAQIAADTLLTRAKNFRNGGRF